MEKNYAYIIIFQDLAKHFEFFELIEVPRGEKLCADALRSIQTVPIHRVEKSIINLTLEKNPMVAPSSGTANMELESPA